MPSAALFEPPPTIADTSASLIAPRQILTLPGVTWTQYVAITDALADRPGLRTSYDGQTLELMTTSYRHEWWRTLLGQLVEILTLQLGIDRRSGGQTTFRDRLVERGLEPDGCYWIQNSSELLGVTEWHAGDHPPPDLAIEIDVTSSSVARQPIYAQLGVPEIWRWNGQSLTALRLQPSGDYAPVEFSVALPFLRVADLEQFLRRDTDAKEIELIRDFIRWINSQQFPQS